MIPHMRTPFNALPIRGHAHAKRSRRAAALLALMIPIAAASGADLLIAKCELSEGWSLHLGSEYFGAKGALSEASAPGRPSCLRVDFDFTDGGRYVGVRLRRSIAAADKIAFSVRMAGAGWGACRVRDARGQTHAASFKVKPGAWRRVVLPLDTKTFTSRWGGPKDGTFYFPLRQVLVAANKGADRKGGFLLDDLSVIIDKPKLEDLWALQILPSAPSGVAFPGEPTTVELVVVNRNKTAATAELRLHMETFDGDKRERKWKVAVPGWGEARQSVTLDTDTPGYTALRGRLVVAGKTAVQTRSAVAVVPRPVNYRKRDRSSFFGVMSICDYEAADRIGVKNVRPQAYWSSVERPKDNYLWGRHDRIMAECQKHGIGMVITVRPENRPAWAAWKSLSELASQKEHLNEVRDFARDIAKRYATQLDGVEILNEPDLTCGREPGVSVEEAIRTTAAITAAGAAGVRAPDPEMPVLALSVSGSDFRRGLEITRGVLVRVPGAVDIYAGHPYSNVRYMGKGRRAQSPEESRVREKLQDALAALKEHGRPPRIWSTELGWAISPLEPLLSDASVEFAAFAARALILPKTVEGVEKLYWFNMRNSGERGYNYGLFQGAPNSVAPHYPMLAACAYAACARMLHHTKPAGPISLSPSARAWRFDSQEHDRAVVAIWTTGERLRIRARVPARTSVVNSLSREVAAGRAIDVVLTSLPVYVAVPLADGDALARCLQKAQLDAENPITLRAANVESIHVLNVDLFNHTNRDVAAVLYSRASTIRHPATLKPGANRVRYPLSRIFRERRPKVVDLTVAGEGVVLKREVNTAFRPLSQVAAAKIDGKLDETRALEAIRLAEHKYVLPPDPTVGWSGPDNLSVTAWIGWNKTGLYFAARVTDDKHVAHFDQATNFWKSDSIQLAIDERNDSGVGFDDDDREVGFVLGKNGPRAFTTYPKPGAALACDLAIVRAGNTTTYEALVPWKTLRLPAPWPGRVMAINFIVNENDGAGRAYWLGLTPGIGSGKSPQDYEEFECVGSKTKR